MVSEFIIEQETVDHFQFKGSDEFVVALDLTERSVVILEFALEVAIIDAAAATANIAQMAGGAWREVVGGCLEVQLMALLHEWFQAVVADVPITLHLRDTIAEINLAVGTNGDAPESTIALH